MQLTIYKVYNRVVHSYLSVFDVVPSADEDPHIFVCKDLPANPPIPPAPPVVESSSEIPAETSSSESEISAEPSSSSEDSSWIGAEESSSSEEVSGISSEEVLESSSSESEPSTSEVSDTEQESGTSSSGDSSSLHPLFEVFPARTLVSVASLTDLSVWPLVPDSPGSLYRASTVAMIFRARRYMESVVSEVVREVHVNAEMQRVLIQDYSVVELQDPVYGQDGSKIFYFR